MNKLLENRIDIFIIKAENKVNKTIFSIQFKIKFNV